MGQVLHKSAAATETIRRAVQQVKGVPAAVTAFQTDARTLMADVVVASSRLIGPITSPWWTCCSWCWLWARPADGPEFLRHRLRRDCLSVGRCQRGRSQITSFNACVEFTFRCAGGGNVNLGDRGNRSVTRSASGGSREPILAFRLRPIRI